MAIFSDNHWTSPSKDAIAVTKSDSTVLPITRALYIGVSGDVQVTTAKGTTALFKGVPVGILPVQVSKVQSTNTTATNILALY